MSLSLECPPGALEDLSDRGIVKILRPEELYIFCPILELFDILFVSLATRLTQNSKQSLGSERDLEESRNGLRIVSIEVL